MENINIGDLILIQCYKHNGLLYREWYKSVVIDITKDYIVCANNKVRVTEVDGRKWRTREPALLFFYRERWFNIIAQFKTNGLFYYCNIASPFIVDAKTIKYIDYDLDLRVFPDESFKILDKPEYEYHRREMNYPKKIDSIVNYELDNLIKMKKKKEGPFSAAMLDKYYKKYMSIAEKIK